MVPAMRTIIAAIAKTDFFMSLSFKFVPSKVIQMLCQIKETGFDIKHEKYLSN